jgi:hypothetical protein
MDMYLAIYILMFLVFMGIDGGLFDSSGDDEDDAAEEEQDHPQYLTAHQPRLLESSPSPADMAAGAEEDLAWFLHGGDDRLSPTVMIEHAGKSAQAAPTADVFAMDEEGVGEDGDAADTLILGPDARIAEGMAGEGDDEITRISDFAEGDMLELQYEPSFDTEGNAITPQVDVSANEDNTAGIIRLDGEVVAEVQGGQALTADSIRLVAAGA